MGMSRSLDVIYIYWPFMESPFIPTIMHVLAFFLVCKLYESGLYYIHLISYILEILKVLILKVIYQWHFDKGPFPLLVIFLTVFYFLSVKCTSWFYVLWHISDIRNVLYIRFSYWNILMLIHTLWNVILINRFWHHCDLSWRNTENVNIEQLVFDIISNEKKIIELDCVVPNIKF